MSYKCLIIDDEPLARELIETYIEKLPEFELIGSCGSAIEASTSISTKHTDLIFLDIEMPVLKGIDFYKNLTQKPEVIFTTAHRDYALDGFELNALDYLLKPIFFERFFSATQKFLNLKFNESKKGFQPTTALSKEEYIFVNKAKKQIKVIYNDILYVESFRDYIKIHLQTDTLMIKESISAFIKRLDNRFIRVHRSYIVNSGMITAYTKNDIEIGRIEIPIGNNYKDNMKPFLKSVGTEY